MGKLDGKSVIVTGASRGIGAEIARVFAAEGGKVACIARTLKEGDHILEGSLEHTVQGIKEAGGEAMPIAADISDYDQCVRAVEQAREAFGPIDVLVNNAALTYFIPIKDYPISKWHRSIGVNFHAPFYFSQLVLQDMLPRRAGAIVNISSGAAIGPGRGPYQGDFGRGGTLYGAEKAALERFTQGLAMEIFDQGISVNTLSPHVSIWSEGGHYFRTRGGDPAYTGWRMSGKIIGDAAVVICNQPAGQYTGNILYDELVMLNEGGMSAEEVARAYPLER